MHLFLQICGVAGFSLLAGSYADFWRFKFYPSNKNIFHFCTTFMMAACLISTYFIFG